MPLPKRLWIPVAGWLAGPVLFVLVTNWLQGGCSIDCGAARKSPWESLMFFVLPLTILFLPGIVATVWWRLFAAPHRIARSSVGRLERH